MLLAVNRIAALRSAGRTPFVPFGSIYCQHCRGEKRKVTMKTPVFALVLLGLGMGLGPATAVGQDIRGPIAEISTREVVTVSTAANVLDEIMSVSARAIPVSLLANAQALVIIPDLLKGGFIVGVRHGHGVVVVRDEAGAWKPPSFVELTGGSVGWQAGIQATDVILVFKTKKSVEGLLNGKFTIGAGVSAAAGPVGREASAATDARLKAEILSYSRSRGLFAGVALDGSSIQIDSNANALYYQLAGGNAAQPRQIPASAERLLQTIARYTATEQFQGEAAVPAPTDEQAAFAAVGRRLAEASRRLSGLLDDTWKRYLVLPVEVYEGRQPSAESLTAAVGRFANVAQNPTYGSLVQRPEFQDTFGLLQHYSNMLSSSQTLALPPPPR